jgi:cardiolipin synthase
VSEVAHAFGWAFAIWGTALYWWAGVLYVVQVRQLVRADRVTTEPAAP